MGRRKKGTGSVFRSGAGRWYAVLPSSGGARAQYLDGVGYVTREEATDALDSWVLENLGESVHAACGVALAEFEMVGGLQEIADEMGVSRERVRQIEARALRKIQCLISDARSEYRAAFGSDPTDAEALGLIAHAVDVIEREEREAATRAA